MSSDDTNLAIRAKSGDLEAFSEFFNLYKEKIYHIAYKIFRNSHEAEDIVQETFLRVYTNLDKYDEVRKFSTWIYCIGSRICGDKLRKKKPLYSLDNNLNEYSKENFYSLVANVKEEPLNKLVENEARNYICIAIRELPLKYQEVIVLRHLNELSLQEMSQILNLPITTIKTRLFRGREYLANKLKLLKYSL